MDPRQGLWLIARVGARLCALPLGHVRETMRPLPVEPLGGAPPFVSGVSMIRGEVVPVVDASVLLGLESSRPTRLVTVDADDRQVALAVDEVLGVRQLGDDAVRDLPPLLKEANVGVLASVGSLDAELLVVLGSMRLMSESVWDLVNAAAAERSP